MRISARTWWIVFLSLIVSGAAIGAWLFLTQQLTAVRWVVGGFDLVIAVWLGYGLWRWREHPLVGRIGVVAIGCVAAGVAVNLFLIFEMSRWVTATLGIWAMSIGFYLALQLLRFILSGGRPVLGVARTLLDEAVRMKVAAVLLVLLFLILPILPLAFDPKERLAYQLQSFLTYAIIIVTTLLSLLTIAIAVTTITRELEDRQIFMTMSKPVGRFQYLAGKWLGMAMLNALLVGVSGVGIYTFTKLLADQPAINAVDQREVHEQVLVARRAISPRPVDPQQLKLAYEQRLTVLRQQDPQRYGQPNEAFDAVKPQVRGAIQQQVLAGWYAIGPRSAQAYIFTELLPAKKLAKTIQLRLQPKASASVPDDKLFLTLRLNGRDDSTTTRPVLDGKYHIIQISTEAIDDQGRLKVEIANPPLPGPGALQGRGQGGRLQPTITFNTTDGLQLLYRVGGFEANLTRTMLLLWLRLSFLGMLALAAGTFLGFPVAALLTVLICVTASGSSYLTDSIQQYSAFPQDNIPLWDKLLWIPGKFIEYLAQGEVWKSIKLIIVLIGRGFMKLVPGFSEFSGTRLVSQGLYVSTELVGRAALWVGLVWTGTVALVGWLIFRSRELARVQV